MPYVKRTTRAGRTKEIERYYTARYNKRGAKRASRRNATSEEQKKINKREAERKLRLILNANFTANDYHVVLSYIRTKSNKRSREEMRRDIDVFLRECRKQYKKKGMELKYVHVMEVGTRGARHHHLVINKCDPDIIQAAWSKAYEGNNRVNITRLDNTGQYGKLAEYLIKYTDTHRTEDAGALMDKRWNCSKNLVRPVPKYEIISHREWFRAEAKAPKGWYIEEGSVERGIHSAEYHGYGFFRYRIIQLKYP